MTQPYFVPEKVSAADQVDALTRQLLRDKLALLAPTSRARFEEIWRHPFPEGDIVAQMSVKQLHQSIGLVDRTLEAAERSASTRG
jgi:hypothetical protein